MENPSNKPEHSVPAGADILVALRDEADRLIEDSLHTGRNHQEAGRRWAVINNWLGLPATIATTLLAGGAGISAILNQQPVVTALLALSAAALSAARGFLRPSESAEAYSLKGNRFIALRNDARLFRDLDLKRGLDAEELVVRIKELRTRYADLNETPPLVVQRRDYLRARKSIEAGESEYEVDRNQKGARS